MILQPKNAPMGPSDEDRDLAIAEHPPDAALRHTKPKFSASMTLIVLVLSGCQSARPPPLSSAAMHVREITAEQGLLCDFVHDVDYTAKLAGWGKTYEIVHLAGENGLRNKVASVGANAVVLTRMDADTFRGKIEYQGQAFECAAKHAQVNLR